jgi:hypothetical protein
LPLFKRGISRTVNEDPQGAIEAYTLAIDHAGAPDDLKAMALYNRALLLAAGGKTADALADLHKVMEIPTSLTNIKLAARRRLERLQHRRDTAPRPVRRATS